MKKLTLIAIFIFSFTTNAFTKWTEADTHKAHGHHTLGKSQAHLHDEDKFFIDYTSIENKDGSVVFSSLMSLGKPSRSGVFSYKMKFEGKCQEFQTRRLTLYSYDGKMGDGNLVSSSEEPTKWSPVVYETPIEALLIMVCIHVGEIEVKR